MWAHWRHRRRLAALAAADDPVLRAYGAAHWPDPAMPVAQAPLLALDFELDGLRRGAHLLQAGWIPFQGTGIALAQAAARDIRSSADLDRDAVTIHGIGSERAASGEPVGEIIVQLVEALAGRVLVAHGADIEIAALQRLTRRLLGAPLPMVSICTLRLERRLSPGLTGSGAYRLMACRARYGLPRYDAHDALTDALAAAELLLAQVHRMGGSPSLAALLRYS